ncbi:MAG: hypothetical protein H7831_08620 [Magnetococcus sp. WYHC-3]
MNVLKRLLALLPHTTWSPLSRTGQARGAGGDHAVQGNGWSLESAWVTLSARAREWGRQGWDSLERLLAGDPPPTVPLYDRQGRLQMPAPASAEAAPAWLPWSRGYRDRAYHVSLSHTARLVVGIMEHVSAGSQRQEEFLKTLQGLADRGELRGADVERARRVVARDLGM